MDRRKLDRLTELASEIGSVEGALDHLAEALRAHGGDPALAREAQRARSVLRRRVRELHEGLLDARMAALDEPFARVASVVRDLAVERQKRVRLVTRGGDTRIDRALAEPVGEALVALVRDAIDREVDATGATLEVNARAHGSRLRVAVHHDGHAVVPGQARDDTVIERVRETLARVGGTVARQEGAAEGITVTIEVPVSVVRIPALVFEASGCLFAIGRDAASGVRAFGPEDVERVDGGEVLRGQDGAVTLYRLADVLGLRADAPATAAASPPESVERGESHAFMFDGSGGRWALAVDRLIGREELVVTAFGPSLRGLPALVGAADLGDERIALVVDARAPFDRSGDAIREREPVSVRGASAAPPRAMTSAATDAALVVEVAGAHYALALSVVREVVAAARVTRVPRAPAGVAGVISRHGAIRTVLDLAWLVGKDVPVPSEGAPIVLVDLDDESVGLRVERVVRVAREASGNMPACISIDPARLFAERVGTRG